MKNHSFSNACRYVAFIAALFLFTASVQADPVLRGYWTFDNDSVDGGSITVSSGYQAAGTHNGVLVGSGISFNPITGESGNHLPTGNYISFTQDSYAYILNTRVTAESETYKDSFDFCLHPL